MYCHTCKNAEADTDDSNLYLEPKDAEHIYYTSTANISTGYSIPNPKVYIQDVTDVTSFCTLLSSGNSSCITMSNKT